MVQLAPSTIWFGFAALLWRRVAGRDRAVCIASLLVPAANRIATLISFGVTIRAIGIAVQRDLAPATEWILGGSIFACFLVAEVISQIAGRVDLAVQRITTRIARGLRAEDLLRARSLPPAQRPEIAKLGRDEEKDFVASSSALMQNLVKFISLVVLVVSLLAVICVLSPVVSGAFALGGVTLLVFLRKRIQPSDKAASIGRKKSRKRLAQMEKDLLSDKEIDEETVASYLDNPYDRLQHQIAREKRARQRKVLAIAGVGSALVMTSIFFLVSRGLFEGIDPAAVVVMILALRLCVSQGKSAMDKWGTLLSERPLMAELRKMAERCAEPAAPRPAETEPSSETATAER
jgi:hypothetical protein